MRLDETKVVREPLKLMAIAAGSLGGKPQAGRPQMPRLASTEAQRYDKDRLL